MWGTARWVGRGYGRVGRVREPDGSSLVVDCASATSLHHGAALGWVLGVLGAVWVRGRVSVRSSRLRLLLRRHDQLLILVLVVYLVLGIKY